LDGDLEVRDPSEVLNTLLPQVKEEAHFVVVLAHIVYAEAVELLGAVEGVNVMVLAQEGKLTPAPVEVNGALVVGGGGQGKFVGQLQIVADTAGQIVEYQGNVVKLDEQAGEDPTMLELIARRGPR